MELRVIKGRGGGEGMNEKINRNIGFVGENWQERTRGFSEAGLTQVRLT